MHGFDCCVLSLQMLLSADGSDDGSDVFPEVFDVIGNSDESHAGGNEARNQSQMLKKREH